MASSAKKKNSKPSAKAKSPAKKATHPKAHAKSPKPAKKSAVKKPAAKPTKTIAARAGKSPKANGARKDFGGTVAHEILGNKNNKQRKLDPFVRGQKEKLLNLRDAMVDSMAGVAKDNLRSRAEGSEASAFGMHQADAGSDAYDRDFALSLLSQEQDALYEIEEALKRIDFGTYGVCEMSGKPIAHARLEALPFARYTVECQSQIEKLGKVTRARVPVTSLFGLTDEEGGGEGEEEEPATDTKE